MSYMLYIYISDEGKVRCVLVCVWVDGKFAQLEILRKGLSEMVTIELRPKDPQKDYLKEKEEQVQKLEKGGKNSHYSPI